MDMGEKGLFEVKCLAKHKGRLIPEAIMFEKQRKTTNQFCLTEALEINKDHNYYHQIQGCLYAAEKD